MPTPFLVIMFRIRKIPDNLFPMNRFVLEQVQEILISRFSSLREDQVRAIPEQLHNPLKYGFRSILFVAENIRGRVRGFAMLMHAPDKNFCFLEYIAARHEATPSGIGSALYERCREEAMMLKTHGIFMESLPDAPALCPEPGILAQNKARLKFWERFGVRPVINTLYETPVKAGETCPPYLLIDTLGRETPISRDYGKNVCEAILRRKYGGYCPEDYIQKVVHSFRDDPVQLRPFRYLRKPGLAKPAAQSRQKKPVVLIFNDNHAIHHVRERGYVESPVRIKAILKAFEGSSMVKRIPAMSFPEKFIRQVHASDLVDYLKAACQATPEGKSVYPYVFPIRNPNRKPKDLGLLAGYYCIDTFTPIHRNVWNAARSATECALTGADQLLGGHPYAYALVRPPGHHAETKVYGGFCYLNSAAIAVQYLSHYARVALLDIDYHHGNGHQEIFYKRKDVLTVSIHGNPSDTFPYFCGFRNEKGEGEGLGYNHNFPLAPDTCPEDYRKVLAEALHRVEKFKPGFLVVSFGLDTAKGDPTGSFSFSSGDFKKAGSMIGSLGLPLLIVQEGGYLTRSMGGNAFGFIQGIYETIA